MAEKYRVGVIGHTGRGNYGHGLDRVWLDIPGCEVVAVADADERGRAAAAKRVKAPKQYADYPKPWLAAGGRGDAEIPDVIPCATHRRSSTSPRFRFCTWTASFSASKS